MMVAVVSADADADAEVDADADSSDESRVAAVEEELYTIDELAAVTGVPSRTIRFYQSKGTLPAPERRGRVAYYDASHVERLSIIAELQDRGLRLDAIRDALQQIEQGGMSLQSWLGMGDRLQAPWTEDRPIVITEPELLDRIGGDRSGVIAELRRLGVIEQKGNSRPATFLVPSPGLLDIGLRLDDAGVDASTAFEAGEIMRRRMGRMADELVEFFDERAGQGFGGQGEPEEIAGAFEILRPTGMQAVQLIFAQEMERALREFVERGRAMPSSRRRPSDRKGPDRKGSQRKRSS